MSGEGISKLKLFHYPATRSARVKWILHETVGDGFETEPLDLYAGVQYSDAFLAKNPNHNVPVLHHAVTDAAQWLTAAPWLLAAVINALFGVLLGLLVVALVAFYSKLFRKKTA